MAMYPPPQNYPQYPTHQIAHQPAVAYGYNTTPARPHYPLDPDSFRRDYSARLNELTVNSRPIIQGLSLYAQEYARWADTVVECVESHIRRVPPWMKLPAFYLIDAICKNVYNPYARHFASVVAPLFLNTYGQVDQSTRGKMDEMLLTWRTGAPGGRELFGVGPQVTIERGIWSQGPENSYRGYGTISKQQVLSELEFALGQKERSLQSNPYDVTVQNNIGVLQQLRKLVEAGVSQQELSQILEQLRSLTQPAATTTTSASSSPSGALPHSYPYVDPRGSSHTAPYHTFEQHAPSPGIISSIPPSPATHPPPSTSTPVPDVSSLFQSLVKSGILSNNGTPTGAGATAKADSPDRELKSSVGEENGRRRAYQALINSEPVRFTSTDISRHRPRFGYMLYDHLPIQCGQCGVRFSDSQLGKKKMQDHLDEHFRANRKVNQSVGRGHSRCWFVSMEEWLNNTSGASKGKGRDVFDGLGKASSSDTTTRSSNLRTQVVVVPAGEEAKPKACPVCKETLKAEFNEDDEEWVWKNATDVDGRIYHATCHADAVSSANALASRLLGRRSSTPENAQVRPSPPRRIDKKSESPRPSGLKRKAETGADSVSSFVDARLPTKKAMLAPAVP